MDIGADEYIDQDWDDLADYWEIRWFGELWLSGEDDPDHDGLPNINEWVGLCDPTNPDTDGDNHKDGDEVLAGTDPLDPESRFEILHLRTREEGLEIECSAVAGRTYRVVVSDDLVEWTPLEKLITPDDDSVRFLDRPDSTRIRFYRVEVLP